MSDPRFAHLTREQLEEAADRCFDGLHKIVFLSPSRRRTFEEAKKIASDHVWQSFDLGFDPTESKAPPCEKSSDRERVGVPGSYHRSILGLMEQIGFRFVEAEGVGHLSRVTLVFDEGTYATRLTIDDVARPPEWPP